MQIDFAWHIKLLSILCDFRPTYFQEIQQKFSVFISSSKTNTNTSLHTATWCNFRARTWQSKFTIGENNFWRRIHIYSLICEFKICIYLKLRPFEIIKASYGSCEWSLLVSIHCEHTIVHCLDIKWSILRIFGCNSQRAEARCYPKKKVPKKTLQIQKI